MEKNKIVKAVEDGLNWVKENKDLILVALGAIALGVGAFNGIVDKAQEGYGKYLDRKIANQQKKNTLFELCKVGAKLLQQ